MGKYGSKDEMTSFKKISACGWFHFLRPSLFRDGGVWGLGGCSPSLFPNITLKQLCFKTLVVKVPEEACEMLYFYLKPPYLKFRSAVPVVTGQFMVWMLKEEFSNLAP